MKFEQFDLERNQSLFEHKVDFNLSESGVHPLKLTEILSPTFNLLYEYDIKDLKIMHYDLYRIKKAEELDHLGIFNDNKESIKIIEWPDLIQIPLDNKLEIYLKYVKNENEREIEFVGLNKWASFANEL